MIRLAFWRRNGRSLPRVLCPSCANGVRRYPDGAIRRHGGYPICTGSYKRVG